MIESIELQVISKLLTCTDSEEVETLCAYDDSYYSVFKEHIQFIYDHKTKYGNIPDLFTFQSRFPDITIVQVDESISYLEAELKRNKQYIILMETFNKLKDLGKGDVSEAWMYLSRQCDEAAKLDSSKPMNIIAEAPERAANVVEFSKKTRIPTGFPEIDKLMYGGMSTVEELLLILARTNTGKSWVCAKMMESANANGFPVAYYSPEMQAAYLATRFDTWRGHFKNSELFQGKYSDEYKAYIDNLSKSDVPAYIIEDKDMMDGVTVRRLEGFVRKNGIRLLIIDGLSYMEDDQRSNSDYDKYKHICTGLFSLSKKYGCAVVVCMQANRETQMTRDDKGVPFPSLYQAEGSDHPGRIATQAFALRQIFETHVLDIRLEKTRMANNTNPVFSYSWDVNTGNMQYIPGGSDSDFTPPPVANNNAPRSSFNIGNIVPNNTPTDDLYIDSMDNDDVEF